MLLCKAKHFKYENISKLAETHYKNPKMNVLNRLDYLWAKKFLLRKAQMKTNTFPLFRIHLFLDPTWVLRVGAAETPQEPL